MADDIYARIRQAASELAAQGIWPTVVDIRTRLGTGSNTTINNTLKQWRQDFLSRMAVSARRPEWPEGLAQAFETVWQRACDAADAGYEEARRTAARDVAALEAAMAERAAAMAALEAERDSLRDACAQHLAALGQAETVMRQQTEDLLAVRAECAALLTAQAQAAQQREALVAEHETALARQAAEHLARLESERLEAARREELAYERVEGLRAHLFAQIEEERQSMQQERRRMESVLQQQREEASRIETALRERLSARERDNGRLEARLESQDERVAQQGEEIRVLREALAEASRQTLAREAELARQAASSQS